MIPHRHLASPSSYLRSFLVLACVVLLALLSASGCKSHSHTSDSRLQKIDEMLNTQLPPGTPMSRVDHFLKSRGYIVEDSPDKNSLVAVVRHVDTDTLQPATARVTFHFDLNRNLISYDLQSAPDAPLRP
jgi:ATP-dependent 26S proteasome regulatory subunit